MKKRLLFVFLLIDLLLVACAAAEQSALNTPLPTRTALPVTPVEIATHTSTVTAAPLPTYTATATWQGINRSVFHSPELGISFKYPADWQEIDEGHYQGEGGFFQVFPYDSLASGLSDEYHGVSFRMVRACTWEANAIPGQYGQDPQLRLLYDAPGRAQCQITPGVGAVQASPTLLVEIPGGRFALLRADERQLTLMQKTLHYDEPVEVTPPGESDPDPQTPVAPELTLHTSQVGELTLEEYSLFPVGRYTPWEEILAGPLQEVRKKRDAWRSGPVPSYEPESLVVDNAALAPFGYRLESFTLENGEQRMRLLRGEQLIKDNLFLHPRTLTVEPISQADFALIVEEPGVGLWLIRQQGAARWDITAHLDSYDVAFAGGQLAAFEFERMERAGIVRVTLESERVYTASVPWIPLDVQIHTWQADWALAMDGSLIVDGEIMNLVWGYGEIFEYGLLNEKPFFFFEQGGQVGIFYGGQELPVRYDEIIHGECCGGINNPRFSEHMAWFYARRVGMWYYVEIGRYD